MTRNKHLRSSVFQRFTRTYLGALVFAAAIIAVVLVGVASSIITRVEIDAQKTALTQMTADLQLQCEIMGGVRDRIVVSNVYQPTQLRVGKFEEIRMLESFSSFVNYSPISASLFLMYPNEELIYTSSQSKALFKYHCANKYDITHEQSFALMQDLLSLRSASILNLAQYGSSGDYLFAFPVMFTKASYREHAVLVFEVEQKQLLERMENISGHAFSSYAIYENSLLYAEAFDESLLEGNIPPAAGQAQARQLKANQYLLSAVSEDGRFFLCALHHASVFAQAVLTYFWQICLVISILTFVFIAFAVAAAARSSRPIRQLAERFGGPDRQENYNEFDILETAILRIESNRENSIRSAREQFLQLLLHGNGNAKMLEQWAQLGVLLDMPCNCVCIVTIDEKTAVDHLIEEIEGFADDHLRLYAHHPAGKDYIIVCCSYRSDYTRSELLDNLSALVAATSGKVFMGESYDTPLKLPVSYHEAKKARQTESNYSRQLGMEYDQISLHLENIRTAVRCGRVDIAESEIGLLGNLLSASDEAITLQKYIHHSLLSCLISTAGSGRETMVRTMESMLVTDFSLFASEFIKTLQENQLVLADESPSASEEIVQYIDQNASDCEMCLDLLADVFSLSADYISQLVKNQTGLPFKEYLIRQRMQIAQHLLLENMEMTINDVAYLSGYRTVSNFIKRFRETTGMTPVQFRKSRSIADPE
ncbi:MAG: AraC family transcriptional regulator [Clostridiales bacterium]|nr:AraC family transcriptional regulator [Clostridiales bacterium]